MIKKKGNQVSQREKMFYEKYKKNLVYKKYIKSVDISPNFEKMLYWIC